MGNIIGSNIFNLLLVLGTTSLLRDIPVEDPKIILDYSIMILITVFLGLILLAKPRYILSRIKGLLLLLIYLVYIIYTSI